jgi:magnesium transporter
MKSMFLSAEKGLAELSAPAPGCWVSLVNPTAEEISEVAGQFRIDEDDLRAALDVEERSRVQVEDDYVLVLVDVPTTELRNKKQWFVTIPLGIVLADDAIITVCGERTAMLEEFESGRVRDLRTNQRSRFTLQLLYRNAVWYLQYLRRIDKLTDAVESKLHVSTRNEELIELLELEKSLVYFNTSLTSNEKVLERLVTTPAVKMYPEDEELLADTIVENKQAMEMATIYGSILSGTMDAYASVIANNQNSIMKTLALVTILMAIPTMIFSAYGMNMDPAGMPLTYQPWGFFAVIAASVVISVLVLVYFARKRWF